MLTNEFLLTVLQGRLIGHQLQQCNDTFILEFTMGFSISIDFLFCLAQFHDY